MSDRQKVVRYEPPIIAGRVPPQDLDAEGAILSAILLSRDALDRVLEIVKPEYFYSEANGRIFEAALDLAIAGKPVDVMTVQSYLRDRETLAGVGGLAYLAMLSDCIPVMGHVEAHAEKVREKWLLRQTIAMCQKVAAEGYGDVGDAHAFIAGAEEAIFAIAHQMQPRRGLRLLKDVVIDRFRGLVEASERGEHVSGIMTGFTRFDSKIGGLRPGDLIVLAARPGMGKTSFAMNVASNVAAKGHGVCVFSLEMNEEQVGDRALCLEARVDVARLRTGYVQPQDWTNLTSAVQAIAPLPMWIDDAGVHDVLSIRAGVRRKQAEWNREARETEGGEVLPARRIGVVVIDYLQLMKGTSKASAQNREQEISGITRGLKLLAKELGVAIIILSQLNRSCETRNDKRPQLSDLRESGAIEQDADAVVFIYRDEYYNPENVDAHGLAELLIAKQRNGPTGRVLVRFAASYTRFDNLAAGDYRNDEAEA